MPALPTGGDSRAILRAAQQVVVWPAQEKEAGRVVAEFIIDRAGHARQARVVKAAPPALDQAALAPVSKLPQFMSSRLHAVPGISAYEPALLSGWLPFYR